MTDDLNSVKTAARQGYHHGALREALMEAAEAVIAARGVDGFSLRETARLAGVSPAAPGHHFGDARGLLTAVAAKSFVEFADALQAAEAGSPSDRASQVRAQGFAYVRFALANRAKFDLMWRKALIDGTDPAYAAAGERAFNILDRAVRGQNRTPGACPTDPVLAPSITAWATVHGFARLILDGVFGIGQEAEARAMETLLPRVLEHVEV